MTQKQQQADRNVRDANIREMKEERKRRLRIQAQREREERAAKTQPPGMSVGSPPTRKPDLAQTAVTEGRDSATPAAEQSLPTDKDAFTEENVVDCSIKRQGDEIVVQAPADEAFVERAGEFDGVYHVDEDQWRFPARHETGVRELCEKTYGPVLPGTPSHTRNTLETSKQAGKARVEYTLTADDKTVVVDGPYDRRFAKAAKRLGGRFNPVKTNWHFPASRKAEVQQMAKRVFGGPPKGVARKSGKVAQGQTAKVMAVGNTLVVKADRYPEAFALAAPAHKGKFSPADQTWRFPATHAYKALSLTKANFGTVIKGKGVNKMATLACCIPKVGIAIKVVLKSAKYATMAVAMGYGGPNKAFTAGRMMSAKPNVHALMSLGKGQDTMEFDDYFEGRSLGLSR